MARAHVLARGGNALLGYVLYIKITEQGKNQVCVRASTTRSRLLRRFGFFAFWGGSVLFASLLAWPCVSVCLFRLAVTQVVQARGLID